MRKASLVITFLALFAVVVWAQDSAPASPQGPPAANEHHHPRGVAGTITAIQENSITLKTRDGQTAQVTLSDKTEYRKDRQPAKLGDFKVGDEIMVRSQKAEDGTWPAEVVAALPAGGPNMGDFRDALGKRFILGEIKSINGTQLTIQRPDGVEQIIAVDENTSFRKDGESITLADMKAGDHVFGRGEVKNGVFTPLVLNLGEPRFMGGPGGGQPAKEPQ